MVERRSRATKRTDQDPLRRPDTADDPTVVDARPTKRFSISVITRDITLGRAILDLIDNAVDAAARKRGAPKIGSLTAAERKRYADLRITVRCAPDAFEITDNCFGMTIDEARNYAFRFGHDWTEEEATHAPKGPTRIGLFGIGLKRGLFKIGNTFRVRSVTENSAFTIDEKVSAWLDRPEWRFHFAELDETTRESADPEIGTQIRITDLHPAVRSEFENGAFVRQLGADVGDALQEYTRRGLTVSVASSDTRLPVQAPEPLLYIGHGIEPLALTFEDESQAKSPATVRLYAGIGPRDLKAAGWNVFCNGRLLLARDQTSDTGWGAKEPAKTPKYHKQFDRFYGYVYFDSDDLRNLPWNTTKTGVDEESPLYLSVRDRMIARMKPIIDMLNELRAEEKEAKDRGGTAQQPVTRAVKKLDAEAKAKPLQELPRSDVFRWPEPASVARKEERQRTSSRVLVAFERPEKEIKKARRYFNVEDNDRAAEAAFLYWLADTRRRT